MIKLHFCMKTFQKGVAPMWVSNTRQFGSGARFYWLVITIKNRQISCIEYRAIRMFSVRVWIRGRRFQLAIIWVSQLVKEKYSTKHLCYQFFSFLHILYDKMKNRWRIKSSIKISKKWKNLGDKAFSPRIIFSMNFLMSLIAIKIKKRQ